MSNITLLEFQQSEGISQDDTLYLIHNPAFYSPFFRCINRCSIRSRLYRKAWRLLGQKNKEVCRIPHRSDILFLGLPEDGYNDLSNMPSLYMKISKNRHCQYAILIGKGDYHIAPSLLDSLPDNVACVFANNVNMKDPRLHYFPMGRDFRNRHLFDSAKPSSSKQHLVYGNFSLNTHPIRETIYASVKDKGFIEFEHMGNFREYNISREAFLHQLAASKFALCPRGNGLDTYRLWDSLAVGTIPIVVREGSFCDDLHDLPILMIDCHEDYASLTQAFLESAYQRILQMSWNYDKLKLSYWLSRVREKHRASIDAG